MNFYELYDLLQFVPYVNRQEWEQTRFLSLVIAQKFCKKRLKLRDMMKFPWEVEQELVLTEDEKKKAADFQTFMLEELNKKTD